MIAEIVIGSIILALGIILSIFFPTLVVVTFALALFVLLAYMIGCAIRELMPWYKGM